MADQKLLGTNISSDASCPLDWGSHGGACWEIFSWPCCSAYCCCCWFCCGLCSMSKFYAHSLKQKCAIVNHCLPTYFLGFCVAVATRHNIRKHHNIGETDSVGSWVGDCLLKCCCGTCTFCQELRSADQDSWDWLADCNKHGLHVMEEPCMFAL